MFGIGMCLYVFYCLCYEMDISTYIFEDQVSEEIYPDLNEEVYMDDPLSRSPKNNKASF